VYSSSDHRPKFARASRRGCVTYQMALVHYLLTGIWSAGRHGLHCTYHSLLPACYPETLTCFFLQISVNATIISDSGGPCVCPTNDLCLTDNTYLTCVAGVRQDMITATAAIAALCSFLMGLLANLPVGLAPGLSLNSYVCASTLSSGPLNQ
jgi:hypothetical protein